MLKFRSGCFISYFLRRPVPANGAAAAFSDFAGRKGSALMTSLPSWNFHFFNGHAKQPLGLPVVGIAAFLGIFGLAVC